MLRKKDPFQRITKRYGFSVPEAYRYLWERGFCTLTRPAAEHDFTRPGNGYLWIFDLEWYSLEEVADFEFPDYLGSTIPDLVPFAVDGGGNYWYCWQTNRTSKSGTPVLLCQYDCDMATVYAPDFAGALYRHILQYACWLYAGEDFAAAWKEGRALLRRYVVDLAPIFPAQWIETLRELERRTPVKWTQHLGNGFKDQPQLSFLTETELAAIKAEQIGLPAKDVEVRWLLGTD